ncbi:MAG TPA: anti-sigma factor [Stellaceae bacterium]|jgi:anti-sigma factor RsiW|nr:anti-sigma factor [Stellaceae bacterium]
MSDPKFPAMLGPMPECEKVLLVQAELDGELDAGAAAALAAHRVSCAICQAAQEELLRVRGLLRAERYETTPDAVRARVMARLRQAEPRAAGPARRPRWNWDWLRGPGLGFGLGAACAAAIALLVLPAERSDLVEAVVADHIRALQPGHLEDVVSTDQHTVKPWFDGRIDFSPPVKDFAAQGFPLKGGRLDYLDNRPVAALVYQRDKHIIDLYLWPAGSAGASATADRAIQGYNAVHWIEDGMNFWAVSDVERTQLDDFAVLWKKAP